MSYTKLRVFTTKARLLIAGSLSVVTLLAIPAIAGATGGEDPGVLVNDKAQSCTPNIKTGTTVYKSVFVPPDLVVAGGDFSQWENCKRTLIYNRNNVVAYQASTGYVQPFKANTDGTVYAVEKTPDNKSIYVGGSFKTVNGVAKSKLAKVDAVTGVVDPNFTFNVDGLVKDIQYCNDILYVSGAFHQTLVAVNPSTGVGTGTLSISVTGSLGASAGATRVDKFSINPACNDLVAIGNFTAVNGVARKSAFRLALGAQATLKDWHPTRFDVACSSSTAYYLRNVEWADTGSYFMIVSSGGPYGGYPATGFCDAAGRWEASSSGSTAQPTWVNWTGGDTLLSVAIDATAHIVYVGGHQRWLDNPEGHDSAGPNAYPVDSIGAINSDTGLADRTWDARPMTRGHGKEDLTLFAGGLIESSDGTTVSGAYHYGTAIFPKP